MIGLFLTEEIQDLDRRNALVTKAPGNKLSGRMQ